MTAAEGRYRLLGADGRFVDSTSPGTLGGNRAARIYGRLDCASANRALPAYSRNRVFFADEETAVAAGYRPCGSCMPRRYALWKAAQVAGKN